jgi:hypothetical protein
MEEAVWRALPDLFAAAEAAPITARFNAEQALKQQATLRVRHSADAWLVYRFDGKQGSLGEGEGGDVFLVPETATEPAHLVFDGAGPRLPLVECARPLSEHLCGNNAFFDTFAAGLEAWSNTETLAERVPDSVRRFRRSRGLSDHDVARWQERLEAYRLDPARRDAWLERVRGALVRFGKVDSQHVQPGLSIKSVAWIDDDNLRRDATDTEVEKALREAFSGPKADTSSMLLLPRVEIAEAHEHAFLIQTELSLLRRYIAAAAMLAGRSSWSEDLLTKLQEIGRREPDADERAAFHRLRCDHDGMLRRRFNLPADASLEVRRLDPTAWAFAGGEIPITKPPSAESAPGELVPWKSEAAEFSLQPLPEEAWLQKARRHATGGARAENAVLGLARAEAKTWLEANAPSFWVAIRTALGRLLEEPRIRAIYESARTAPTDQCLTNILQVSSYAGNAGFDLLFPSRAEGKVLRVEVKRVASLDNATFFLSENERRQALTMDDWRLWLIASDGQNRDVSWIRKDLENTRDKVVEILDRGMRPGDWLFRVK